MEGKLQMDKVNNNHGGSTVEEELLTEKPNVEMISEIYCDIKLRTNWLERTGQNGQD